MHNFEHLFLVAVVLAAAALIAMALRLSRRLSSSSAAYENALKLSEERLHLAVTGSNDGLWDWDVLTDATYYSPRVYELLHYGPGELKPHIDAFLELLYDEDRDEVRAALLAHLRAHRLFDSEFRMRLKSGCYRWFRARGQAVRNPDGRAVRMAGSITDITQRKLAESALCRQAMQQGLIAAFGQLALKNPPLDELMSRAVWVVGQGLQVEFCRLLSVGDDDISLLMKGAWGWDAKWMEHPVFDAVEETEDYFIVGIREAVIVDDFRRETRLKPSAMLRYHGILSGAAVLICGAQDSYGVLGIYSREAAQFTAEHLNFLRGITNILASSIDRQHADQRLTYMAQFDSLTGLPNRNMYLDRLRQAITQADRDKSTAGVVFVDLDRFKIVNDTLGHGAGDDLLFQVAQRLQACVRAADTVGRLGGDEFAVTLGRLTHAEDAALVSEKILEGLSRPFSLSGQEVHISASLGIGIYPEDGKTPDVLLKNADTAMYRAKESGRNNYQFYFSQMNERNVERHKLETELRGALDRDEFLLHYQPKGNIAGGRISGFEALLRWRHPERGLLAPAKFMTVLEETGLIVPVGEWVVGSVCRQIKRWQAEGLAVPPIAINLSPRQCGHKDFEAAVGSILEATGVDPGLLEFELSESMLMIDSESTVRALKNIKARGIALSVDNFGTAYASLANLKRFPLNTLKIDRTFIRDVTTDSDDATIAVAIINLARSLKLKVVAEGVETEAQFNFLSKNACDEMQGYYFSAPMPADTCTQALVEGWCLPSSAVHWLSRRA